MRGLDAMARRGDDLTGVDVVTNLTWLMRCANAMADVGFNLTGWCGSLPRTALMTRSRTSGIDDGGTACMMVSLLDCLELLAVGGIWVLQTPLWMMVRIFGFLDQGRSIALDAEGDVLL